MKSVCLKHFKWFLSEFDELDSYEIRRIAVIDPHSESRCDECKRWAVFDIRWER